LPLPWKLSQAQVRHNRAPWSVSGQITRFAASTQKKYMV